MRRYWLNIIEEAVLNPDYAGCVGGRIEVWEVPEGEEEFKPWAVQEIRFLTRKRDILGTFRDRWDGVEVDRQTLGRLAVEVQMVYRDGVRREKR